MWIGEALFRDIRSRFHNILYHVIAFVRHFVAPKLVLYLLDFILQTLMLLRKKETNQKIIKMVHYVLKSECIDLNYVLESNIYLNFKKIH